MGLGEEILIQKKIIFSNAIKMRVFFFRYWGGASEKAICKSTTLKIGFVANFNKNKYFFIQCQ